MALRSRKGRKCGSPCGGDLTCGTGTMGLLDLEHVHGAATEPRPRHATLE